MSKQVRVKPGKVQSITGFIVGIIFCIIGISMIITHFSPFLIVWTLIAVVITVSNGINAFTDKGIASHEITIEEDHRDNLDIKKTAEERLNELQSLYEKNMITPEEFQKKHNQILEDI